MKNQFDTQNSNSLSRRNFMECSLAGMMGTMLSQPGFTKSDSASFASRSRVVIVRHDSVLDSDRHPRVDVLERMVENGLLELTRESDLVSAWRHFLSPMDCVALKSNLGIQPTHHELHAVIMKQIADLGVSSDRIRVWDRNHGGIGLDQTDPRFWNWNPDFDRNNLSRAIAWANTLIHVPTLKTHPISDYSGAVKNWAGAVTRINHRDENVSFAIHANQCANVGCIPAIPAIRQKCRLIIADALLLGYSDTMNPGKVTTIPYRGILMGTDPVAIDRVGWELLQNQGKSFFPSKRASLPQHLIQAASQFELGNLGWDRIDVRFISMEDSLQSV